MTPKNAVNVIAKNGARPYGGPINLKTMSKSEMQAMVAFRGAKQRSKRAGLPDPEMCVRDFMGWWLKELESFKGTIPTCGRIDHSRGYFWDNIEMQDKSENSREVRQRTKYRRGGRPIKKVVASLDGEPVLCFRTQKDAAEAFCVGSITIAKIMSGKIKASSKVLYKLEAA